MPRIQSFAWLALVFSPIAALAGEPLKVDLNPDNDRKDVLSRNTENWRITDGREVSRSFGKLTVTIRKAGNAGSMLTGIWRKAGYDTGAVFASDGISVKDGDRGGQIQFILSGLTAGQHSLVTYHNSLAAGRISSFSVALNGQVRLRKVQPSVRATDDYDAATAYVEFDVQDQEPVVILFVPDGTGEFDNIVINGFALDAGDPTRLACKPWPHHGDEHAPENPTLTWSPAKHATAHQVYVGTSRDAVANATPQSPEFKGAVREGRFSTQGLNAWETYYWRVDELEPDDPAHPVHGEIWRFQVRRLAFPGAEGYGRFARGGRGGRVIEVTNLHDDGPGSLRAAVEADGPRTVVFRVGGTIPLASKLVIRNPYITIAGQTAPGDGIAVRGYTFGSLGTHDVVIRHVRIRVGDEAQLTMDGTGFASTDHAIMDHCSVSWSIDEAVSSRGAGNITFQRSIVAEALHIANHKKYEPGKGHSFAGSISGNIGSFHHNLVAHCAGRNWSLAGGLTGGGKFAGYLDIRNNVVYNWERRTTDGGVKALNFVNNYYIPGPATKVFHLVKPDAGSPIDPQQYYIAGNAMEGRDQYSADNWANGGVVVDPALVSQIKLSHPFCESHVATQTAREAYASVIEDVGANWPRLDAIDQRIMHDVLRRTTTAKGSRGGLPGIIDSQSDVGGWPQLAGGEPPADSDRDGMSDVWETAQGLKPNDSADGKLVRSDDYTNLEHHLNSILMQPTENRRQER